MGYPELREQWSRVAAHGNLFWRLHPASRAFTPDAATSTPFVAVPGEVGTQQGFSCFANPWHLWLYVNQQFGSESSTDTVMAFTGERVGTGMDGEDLVVPDMKTVTRYTWSQFEQELLHTPLPPTPQHGTFTGWHNQSWKTFLDYWQGSSLILDHIRDAVGAKV